MHSQTSEKAYIMFNIVKINQFITQGYFIHSIDSMNK